MEQTSLIEIPSGIDLDYFAAFIDASLASDFTVSRSVERAIETLERLERKLKWRVKHYGGMVFTPQEVKAMYLEIQALEPTTFGPQRATNVQTYIAGAMAVTQGRVSQLLASANKMMLFLNIANSEYVGWIDENAGRRDRAGHSYPPKWELCAPTARQVENTLTLVTNSVRIVGRAA